jgi:hypothetical protein
VSTDLFVCTVHCEPFPPPPLTAIHIVMRAQKILSTKYTKCWYITDINQLLHSIEEVTQWCSGLVQD